MSEVDVIVENDEPVIVLDEPISEEGTFKEPETGHTEEVTPEPEKVIETEHKEVPAFYAGKTSEELVDILSKKDIESTRIMEENADLRKKTEELNISPEEIRARLTAGQLKTVLDGEKLKLRQMDRDDDPEAYDAISDTIEDIRADYTDKRSRESYTSAQDEQFNSDFVSAHASVLNKQGFDLKPEQYDSVIETAKKYSDGRLSEKAVQHALLETFGPEVYTKTMKLKIGETVRDDIIAAEGKTQPIVDAGTTGRTGTRITRSEYMKLPEHKQAAIRDRLSPDQLKKLRG